MSRYFYSQSLVQMIYPLVVCVFIMLSRCVVVGARTTAQTDAQRVTLNFDTASMEDRSASLQALQLDGYVCWLPHRISWEAVCKKVRHQLISAIWNHPHVSAVSDSKVTTVSCIQLQSVSSFISHGKMVRVYLYHTPSTMRRSMVLIISILYVQ